METNELMERAAARVAAQNELSAAALELTLANTDRDNTLNAYHDHIAECIRNGYTVLDVQRARVQCDALTCNEETP